MAYNQGCGRKQAVFAAIVASVFAGVASTAIGESAAANVQGCAGMAGEHGLRSLTGIVHGQYLLPRYFPSDLDLQCGRSSIDVGGGLEVHDAQVKSSGFSTKTDGRVRAVEVKFQGGGKQFRYGIQLQNEDGEFSTLQDLVGVQGASSKTKRTENQSLMQFDAAGTFGAISAGAGVRYISVKRTLEQPIAGEPVTTKGPQLSGLQPIGSIGWRIGAGLVTIARHQAIETTKDGETLRQPWRTNLRYVQILEGDQGVRVQFERFGPQSDDTKAANRTMLSYYLTVDDVTVDVSWAQRFATYKDSSNASPEEIAAFEFAGSLVWRFAPQIDFYGMLHSLSGNEDLGGQDRRRAQMLATGASLGVRLNY